MSYFWLGRKYQLCKTLYFDEYMQVLGVGLILRKMGNSVFPIVQVTFSDETEMYTMTTTTEYFTNEITFRFDEEFDEETIDGRKCRSVISLRDNTMVHVQSHPKVTATIVREFCETGMLAAFMACDKKSIRMYKNYIEETKSIKSKEEEDKKEDTASKQVEMEEDEDEEEEEEEEEEE